MGFEWIGLSGVVKTRKFVIPYMKDEGRNWKTIIFINIFRYCSVEKINHE